MIDANIDILEQDIKDRITSFKKRTSGNKKKAAWVVILSSFISALTTILIGISSIVSGDNPEYSRFLNIIALITSSSLPILLSWDTFFNHKKLWVQYTDTLTKLYDLEADFQHLKKNFEENKREIDQNVVNEIYMKYKDILQNTNQNWIGMRKETLEMKHNPPMDKK